MTEPHKARAYGTQSVAHTHSLSPRSPLSSSPAHGAPTTKSHQKFKLYFGKHSEQFSTSSPASLFNVVSVLTRLKCCLFLQARNLSRGPAPPSHMRTPCPNSPDTEKI